MYGSKAMVSVVKELSYKSVEYAARTFDSSNPIVEDHNDSCSFLKKCVNYLEDWQD